MTQFRPFFRAQAEPLEALIIRIDTVIEKDTRLQEYDGFVTFTSEIYFPNDSPIQLEGENPKTKISLHTHAYAIAQSPNWQTSLNRDGNNFCRSRPYGNLERSLKDYAEHIAKPFKLIGRVGHMKALEFIEEIYRKERKTLSKDFLSTLLNPDTKFESNPPLYDEMKIIS